MDSLIGAVPDSWIECQLDEVCDILAGPSIAQDVLRQWETGLAEVPVVTPKDLRHNRIAHEPSTGVTNEVAGELSRYRLLPGDIVCARTGQLGRQGLVGEHQGGWLIGSGCLRLRPNLLDLGC